jgi:hypothetical protein
LSIGHPAKATIAMSNHPWVCFSCRQTVRRPSPATAAVTCALCGGDCTHLSPMVKIPPKNKTKEWEKLRDSIDLDRTRRAETHRIKILERNRWLKLRIQALEKEPSDPNRDYLLQKYRQELLESP